MELMKYFRILEYFVRTLLDVLKYLMAFLNPHRSSGDPLRPLLVLLSPCRTSETLLPPLTPHGSSVNPLDPREDPKVPLDTEFSILFKTQQPPA